MTYFKLWVMGADFAVCASSSICHMPPKPCTGCMHMPISEFETKRAVAEFGTWSTAGSNYYQIMSAFRHRDDRKRCSVAKIGAASPKSVHATRHTLGRHIMPLRSVTHPSTSLIAVHGRSSVKIPVRSECVCVCSGMKLDTALPAVRHSALDTLPLAMSLQNCSYEQHTYRVCI